MSRAAVVVGLGLSACAPAPVALPGFDAADFAAILQLDARGALVAASPVAPLDGPLDALGTAGATLVVVGWPASAFAGREPDPGEALVARADCAPALPPPTVAATLLDAPAPRELASLPALSAAWADALCEAGAIDRLAFRLRCKDARCPWTTRALGACRAEVDLPCAGARLDVRVDASGGACLRSALTPGASAEDACAMTPARAPAVATVDCAVPEACVIDALVERPPPLAVVHQVRVSEEPPYVPDPQVTGTLAKMPSGGDLLGLGYDVAPVGDRLVASSRVVASRFCAASTLRSVALDDLTPIATATAPQCLVTLGARDDTSFFGVWVDGGRFHLGVYDRDLRLLRRTGLDERAAAAPGEPPVSVPECERAVEVVRDGDRVAVVMAHGTDCPGLNATVHVFDARTLAALRRGAVDVRFPYHARWVDGLLWLAGSDDLHLRGVSLDDLSVRESLDVPPGFARVDLTLFDFARDAARAEWVVATARDQPVLRRDAGAGTFTDRAYFLPHEADPVGVWAAPFVGEHGVVLGTQDGNRGWRTEAALYDRATLTVLPGGLEVGYGPPRRILPDGRGGLLLFFPWDARLVRLARAD